MLSKQCFFSPHPLNVVSLIDFSCHFLNAQGAAGLGFSMY